MAEMAQLRSKPVPPTYVLHPVIQTMRNSAVKNGIKIQCLDCKAETDIPQKTYRLLQHNVILQRVCIILTQQD